MVSKRQKKVKAIRKARGMAVAYMTEAFKKIVADIRTDSFKSVFGVRNAVFGSAYSDKGTIKRDADIPGKVGTGLIVSTARKDPYLECFPEDLDWASDSLDVPPDDEVGRNTSSTSSPKPENPNTTAT